METTRTYILTEDFPTHGLLKGRLVYGYHDPRTEGSKTRWIGFGGAGGTQRWAVPKAILQEVKSAGTVFVGQEYQMISSHGYNVRAQVTKMGRGQEVHLRVVAPLDQDIDGHEFTIHPRELFPLDVGNTPVAVEQPTALLRYPTPKQYSVLLRYPDSDDTYFEHTEAHTLLEAVVQVERKALEANGWPNDEENRFHVIIVLEGHVEALYIERQDGENRKDVAQTSWMLAKKEDEIGLQALGELRDRAASATAESSNASEDSSNTAAS